jgi:hypothetical protein
MNFDGIHDRLRVVKAPGLLGADVPRPAIPGREARESKDPGRGGDPFVLVDPREIVPFLHVCRDEDRLRFDSSIDLTATDPRPRIRTSGSTSTCSPSSAVTGSRSRRCCRRRT